MLVRRRTLHILSWAITLTLAISVTNFSTKAVSVVAASGMPDSSEFGYGAIVDPWGMQPETAIHVADGVGLDWIAIDFDWARHYPEKGASPSFDQLDYTMALAQRYRINVLLSIQNPPTWAIAPLGPDVALVTSLVSALAARYTGNILAIELFPYANTPQGWGAAPNPVAYAAMLQQVSQLLQSLHSPIVLVAGGLVQTKPEDGVSDLEFLSDLYAAGAASYMPVLGLRLERLSGEPMSAPASTQQPVLRHYEAVRQVMLSNGHDSGLIWITGYSWPESISGESPSQPANWLNQALALMKSQLYIGAAFFNRMNPAGEVTNPSVGPELISASAGQVHLHPALTSLAQNIALSRGDQPPILQLTLDKRLVSGTLKRSIKP